MPREPDWWYRGEGLTARALAPLAYVYGEIAARSLSRAVAYRSRLPVICVGNFTAGGSGKTPFTAMLLPMLIARGERPVVLTRGYGGREAGPHLVDLSTDTWRDVGDEPLLLARLAPVMVARDRAAGARAIEALSQASVIVMDDGLQNGALHKDLTIAVVDGARGVGNGRVIPAGPLRMPLPVQGGLVDAIVFNGATHEGLEAQLAAVSSAAQIIARLEPAGDNAWLAGARVVAFAGIGHPARFFALLERMGAQIVERIAFGDHAAFSDRDADRLLMLAGRHGARLVTTSKDHVRIGGSAKLDVLASASAALPVAMVLDDPAALDALLDRALRRG